MGSTRWESSDLASSCSTALPSTLIRVGPMVNVLASRSRLKPLSGRRLENQRPYRPPLHRHLLPNRDLNARGVWCREGCFVGGGTGGTLRGSLRSPGLGCVSCGPGPVLPGRLAARAERGSGPRLGADSARGRRSVRLTGSRRVARPHGDNDGPLGTSSRGGGPAAPGSAGVSGCRTRRGGGSRPGPHRPRRGRLAPGTVGRGINHWTPPPRPRTETSARGQPP
jgi:hypothetical protein